MPGISAVSPPISAQPAGGSRRRCRRRRPGRRDIQLAGREVIQKNQRLRPLDHQVVDAHGDKVDADGIVNAGGQRDHQFRAHPVGRGHHQRVAVTGGGGVEESAEPAQRGIGAGPRGASGQRLDGLDQFLARVDIDAGRTVIQPVIGCFGCYGILTDKPV